eukprot:scaffold3210_cov402-Prasinococcus_capsulatus_cf.AAC.8
MASVLRHSWILPAIEEGLANLTEKRFFVRQSIQCSTCQCLQIGQGVRTTKTRSLCDPAPQGCLSSLFWWSCW